MKSYIKSWQWNPPKGLAPAVHFIMELRDTYPKKISQICMPVWILDYEWNTLGKYKCKTIKHPWILREPGVFHLWPPNFPFWEDTRKEKGTRWGIWMGFSGGEMLGLLKLLNKEYGYARFQDSDQKLIPLLKKASEVASEKKDRGFNMVQAIFYQIADYLLGAQILKNELYKISSKHETHSNSSFCDQVNEFLFARITKALGLGEIAKNLHISPSSLSHRYKKECGISPMQAFRNFKIAQAKLLIKRGESLKKISDQLAFSDVFHFSKTFKNAEGFTPGNYRKGQFL